MSKSQTSAPVAVAESGKTASGSESGVQVITRAAQLLRALGESHSSLSLSELASRLGLPRSTVHRLVVALEAEHLVGRAGERDGYRLGTGLISLGQAARSWMSEGLRAQLQGLSQRLNETVDISVREGDQVVFVDQILANQRLQVVSGVGLAFPLHCTANGKALLATLSDEQILKWMPETFPSFTPSTITSRKALMSELGKVRERGVAFDYEEYTPGICAVGVAVAENVRGLYAVSVPVPAQRFHGQADQIASALQDMRQKLATGTRHPDGLQGSADQPDS